jgi:hypothetical protein
MPQSPIHEALAKLKTQRAEDVSGKPLEALENLFDVSRGYQGGFSQFLQELVQTVFWQSQNYPGNPYLDLCLKLGAQIDRYNDSLAHPEPTYHSRKHFQDVCLSLTALLDQHATQTSESTDQTIWTMSPEEAWILLLCAIAHDYGHDGSMNTSPSQLERGSIAKTQSFLLESSIPPALAQDLCDKIEPIILATDPACFNTLLSKFTDPINQPNKTDCMCMLMVEADLLASALPQQGQLLGKLLSQEWQPHHPQAAIAVASDQGRLNFLEHIRFISPYAMMLKMEDIRKQSIEELKD